MRQLLIRSRELADLKLTFTSGESGTKYVTLKAGAVYSRENLKVVSGTLYIQSPVAGITVEIEEWS